MKRLAAVAATIVWPFERMFSRLGQKVVTVSDGVERIESIFVRLGWALAWPVRRLWRLLAGVADGLVPGSVREALAAADQRFSRGFVRTAEVLNLDGVVLWLIKWT